LPAKINFHNHHLPLENHDEMDEFDLFKNSSSKSPKRNLHQANHFDSDFDRDYTSTRDNKSG
jgi:hypothetical protein